ncbi:RPM1-interacting protein 4, partial [Cucurbita argyrosperma subsp. sororia]
MVLLDETQSGANMDAIIRPVVLFDSGDPSSLFSSTWPNPNDISAMSSKQGGKAKPLKQPKVEKKDYDEVDMANIQKKKDEEKSRWIFEEVKIRCSISFESVRFWKLILVELQMARSSQVPKFGKWDDGDDVPYTAYFDNATKAKLNQRRCSCEEANRVSIAPRCPGNAWGDSNGIKSAKSRGQQASRPKHAQEDLGLEDGNMKKHVDSPLDHQSIGRVSFNSPRHQRQANSPHHQREGNNTTSNSSKRTTRNGVGSDCSIENSPLHPRQHPRTEAKTAVPSSPLRERRGSGSPKGGSHDGLAPSTPGRSRQRSVPRGNESPDRSATVPKFGDWDESDPTSSENYSGIFTRVREERQSEDGSLRVGTNVSSATSRKRSENSKRCGCFPWGK